MNEGKNRGQRRSSKFGAGRTTERGDWPQSRPNPAFMRPAGMKNPATAKPVDTDPGRDPDGTPGASGDDPESASNDTEPRGE